MKEQIENVLYSIQSEDGDKHLFTPEKCNEIANEIIKSIKMDELDVMVREKKLVRGCVIMMKSSSGMVGYGNAQCVSWVSEELGELSLYGHNQCHKTYDVDKIIEYPIIDNNFIA